MINTAHKKSIYERVSDVYAVLDWQSESDFSVARKMIENTFQGKNIHFILIADEEVKEKFAQQDITVLTKKSLNLMGKWKSTEELTFATTKNEKIVVYFCTEMNKLVNKLHKSFSQAIQVSYINEKMTNFDVSFNVKIGNKEELLNQTKKYLKRL